jgi:hypothetical protein
MKWLSLIICLYVITLFAYPCQDCGISSTADNHTAQDCDKHHDENSSECHHCTPFCVCNCCQVVVLTSLNIHTGIIGDLPMPVETLYKEILTEGIRYTIWQPPKA